VVRSDEQIIEELIAAASHVARLEDPRPPSEHDVAPSSADTESDPGFSLKSRVGRRVASEEKQLIAEVLTKTNWNRRKAAELLEISYRSLLYKIKDYNLNSSK